MTITQAHQFAKRKLTEAGQESEEAHAAARILLDFITGARHAHLTRGDDELSDTQQGEFERGLDQLAAGRPLPYVTGTREFYGLTFKCDERALVPRPETELMIEAAVKLVSGISQPKIADLGTGTGCIAITLAKQLPQARIYASDVSAGARELAGENAELLGVSERIQFVRGEYGQWAAPLAFAKPFDLLVSNPPYIATEEIASLQTQVRDYEPRSALDGGADGLDDYCRLATQCKDLLKPAGSLLCELGAGQWESVRDIFEEEGWSVGDAIIDLQGISRVLVATVRK